MDLLREPRQPGYPTSYLTARVQGRRQKLIRNWQPYLMGQDLPVATDEEIRAGFLGELRWAYRQMNRGLRRDFAPVIGYFELHTLFMALRFLAAGSRREAQEVAKASLLHETIGEMLRRGVDIAALLPVVAEMFKLSAAAGGDGLNEIYRNSGLRGVERLLADTFLYQALQGKPHRHVAFFVRAMIDLRNTRTAMKHQRWGLGPATEAVFWTGAIPRRLTETEPVDARQLFGQEHAMLQNFGLRLLRLARSADPVAVLLCHLWRHFIQARNLGLLLHGREVSSERVSEELLQ